MHENDGHFASLGCLGGLLGGSWGAFWCSWRVLGGLWRGLGGVLEGFGGPWTPKLIKCQKKSKNWVLGVTFWGVKMGQKSLKIVFKNELVFRRGSDNAFDRFVMNL